MARLCYKNGAQNFSGSAIELAPKETAVARPFISCTKYVKLIRNNIGDKVVQNPKHRVSDKGHVHTCSQLLSTLVCLKCRLCCFIYCFGHEGENGDTLVSRGYYKLDRTVHRISHVPCTRHGV